MTNNLATVLVVDDHPVNQKVLQLLLDHMGFASDVAANGRQAVEMAQRNRYAVILMDVMMPEMDGFEATQKIRDYEFDKAIHTPIIAVTALSEDRVREKCLLSGMDDYISKPIAKEILLHKVERWMQLSTAAVIADDQQSEAMEAMGEHPIDSARLKLLYEMEDLQPILHLFLDVTETLLQQLKAAIGEQNASMVAYTAHELKGSSYAVSAREMAKLSLELEHAGGEGRWNEALKIYAALALGFCRVKEYLQNGNNVPSELKMSD
ncbi:MAG TPA: response regulator [Candidatus Obscuribacterales bacterium]